MLLSKAIVGRRPKCASILMATMRFSVPDEVRDRFETAFRGHDRSAVVTGLLLLAVEVEERRQRRSASLTERLLLAVEAKERQRRSLSLIERLRRLGAAEARPAAGAEP
jgi:hypothetical protein